MLPRIETGNLYVKRGTLAVVSAAAERRGSSAEDVIGADWAPDGASLAVHRHVDGKERLEFPVGTLLYEPPYRLIGVRVSPTGQEVAFFETDAAGLWSVVVVKRSGARQVLSAGWADWWNLAWSPDGREVWFGGARVGAAASIYAVDHGGRLGPSSPPPVRSSCTTWHPTGRRWWRRSTYATSSAPGERAKRRSATSPGSSSRSR